MFAILGDNPLRTFHLQLLIESFVTGQPATKPAWQFLPVEEEEE